MDITCVENFGVALNGEGFLCNLADWNEAIAKSIAQAEQIELNAAHWEIILCIRQYYQTFKHLPNLRVFIKLLAKELGIEKGNSRYLHQLFPQTPLKLVCKIAGLPKPPTCL